MDEQRAVDRLARVKADHQDGKIDAEDWRDQRAKLNQGIMAARAEVARLRGREHEVVQAAKYWNPNSATVQYLADLKSNVAGQLANAKGIKAARAALSRMFVAFTIHPARSPTLNRRMRPAPLTTIRLSTQSPLADM